MNDPDGVLGAVLARLGLPAGLLSPLKAHARAVSAASPRLGLVSTGDEPHVVRRHSADSLLFAVARAPLAGERWVDVGSGGGFPGLVLAICYPETRFWLVESNRKKAGFLSVQSLDLGLDNVEVLTQRAESVLERFDVATARAVSGAAKAFTLLLGLVRLGGVAMVASTETVAGAHPVHVALPDVDSPGVVLMMTATQAPHNQPEHGR